MFLRTKQEVREMGKTMLDERLAEAVVLGGAVLGGGGGGEIEDGLERARLAVRLGSPVLISLDDLDDEDLVVTASAVGASAAKERYVRPVDHIKSTEMILHARPTKLAGVIANENGAGSGVNGWLQGAALDLPIVDAPANGRSHPTGLMGAMGLHRIEGYRSIQSAVGGNPAKGRHLEMWVEGDLRVAANMVRQASVHAGGIVAVSRDPVPAAYLRDHAAPGATSQAIQVGERMMAVRGRGAAAIMEAISATLEGRITCRGEVIELRLETVGGYDIGHILVQGDMRGEVTFWNEFMTLDLDGRREATFPDLITFLSLDTGMPVASAGVQKGDCVGILVVPKANLILGEGVRLPETLQEAERAIGRPLL
jgi:DUF917 family protein